MKKNVAILMGGYSSEYAVSIKSGEVVYEKHERECLSSLLNRAVEPFRSFKNRRF